MTDNMSAVINPVALKINRKFKEKQLEMRVGITQQEQEKKIFQWSDF